MGNKKCAGCVHLRFTGGQHGLPPYTCFASPVAWPDNDACESYNVVVSSGFEWGGFFKGFLVIMLHFAVFILALTGLLTSGIADSLSDAVALVILLGLFVLMWVSILYFTWPRNKDGRKTQTASPVVAKPKKAPSKAYKPLAWTALGIYSFAAFYFVGYLILEELNVAVPDAAAVFGGLFVAVGLPVCIIIGVIALVKRRKYKPKDRPKAKFNIWALLALLVPVIGFVFAIISLSKKEYSSLSRYLSCWIAVSWLSVIIIIVATFPGA